MALEAVFIDRDGTINVEKGYVYRTEDFEFIPGALSALKLFSDQKIQIYIITNQAGIGRGLYTERDFADLTQFMLGQMSQYGIQIANVLYCPHHPNAVLAEYREECQCRKPKAGMLKQVIDNANIPARSMALIGDKNSDIEAGRATGIRAYLVRTGYGSGEEHATNADFVVDDLHAAAVHLLRSDA